ncbi:hypothetical protein J2Y63_004132 [Shinella sp. BE166]|uniref:hypothetical protein n=1 Tax=Shinella sp. BE166 TaxID=3373918 RepID=UPI003EB75529
MVMITDAEARRASCLVMTAPDPQNSSSPAFMMSFDVDDTVYPHFFNVTITDGDTSDKIEIGRYDPKTARNMTDYFDNVAVRNDDYLSKFSIELGRAYPQDHYDLDGPKRLQSSVTQRYALYIDWKGGTAGWLEESAMYNMYDILSVKPQYAARPVSCDRLD